MRLLAYSLLPDVSSITDKSSAAAAFAYLTFLHEVVPGFVVGSVLGAAAAILLPQRRLALLMLPAVIVFIGAAIHQQMSIIPGYLIQRDWNWLLTVFLPSWLAFFFATASEAVIGKKLIHQPFQY